MKLFQFVLGADGCSGRAVRMRVLSPSETDQLSIDVAAELGKDAAPVESHVGLLREAMRRMLVSYTAKTGLKSNDDSLKLTPEDWTKVSGRDWTMGTFRYNEIFTAKDDVLLNAFFRMHHNASAEEVDRIVGKALEVSED